MAERTALIPARWWADEQAARSLLGRVDASEQGRASVVLGLHALLGGYLAPLREATLVDRALIHCSIEEADLELLEHAVSKAFGQSDLYSHLAVQDLRRRAQQGADRSMVVFSTLPAPVAVDRAVAAAGVPGEYLGPYWNTVKTPGVLPLVRDDAADRALMTFAQKYAVSSPVAKSGRERFREEDVSRDEDGKFAQKGGAPDPRRKRLRRLSELNRLNDQRVADQRESARVQADSASAVRQLSEVKRPLSEVKRPLSEGRKLSQVQRRVLSGVNRKLSQEDEANNEKGAQYKHEQGKMPPGMLLTAGDYNVMRALQEEYGGFTAAMLRDKLRTRSGVSDVPTGVFVSPNIPVPNSEKEKAAPYHAAPGNRYVLIAEDGMDIDPDREDGQIAMSEDHFYQMTAPTWDMESVVGNQSGGNVTFMGINAVASIKDKVVSEDLYNATTSEQRAALFKSDAWNEAEVNRDEDGKFAEKDNDDQGPRRRKRLRRLQRLNSLQELNRPVESEKKEERKLTEVNRRLSTQQRRLSAHTHRLLSNDRMAQLEDAAKAVADPVRERERLGELTRYVFDDDLEMIGLFGIGVDDIADETPYGGVEANIDYVTVEINEEDSIPEALPTFEDAKIGADPGIPTHFVDAKVVARASSMRTAIEHAAKEQEADEEHDFDVVVRVAGGETRYEVLKQTSGPKIYGTDPPKVFLLAQRGTVSAYHRGQDVTLRTLEGSTMAEVVANYPDSFSLLKDGTSLLRPVQVVHARISTS